jgi:thiaminase
MAPMLMESDKVMFEIYREPDFNRAYRVVYFTELGEHNKEYEINRALSSEHFYDGFIRNYHKDDAKKIIEDLLKRLNAGESITPEDFQKALADYIPA